MESSTSERDDGKRYDTFSKSKNVGIVCERRDDALGTAGTVAPVPEFLISCRLFRKTRWLDYSL